MDRAIQYAEKLKKRSGTRIAIKGRLPNHSGRVQVLCNSLKDMGFRVIIYTGAWGGYNVRGNPKLLDWVQRDRSNNPLGYEGSLRSGMLCPRSLFIDQILLPEILKMLTYFNFDTIFFNIPWIWKGGCYCKMCQNDIDKEDSNNKKSKGVIN